MTQGEGSLKTDIICVWSFPALICAQLAQSRKRLCADRSYRSIDRTCLTGQKTLVSHLHLLVDLPLYGVRRFSAAFIFRRSPFLHLWHSPASGWIRSGSLLRVCRRVLQRSNWEWKLSLSVTAAVIPYVSVPHLGLHTIRVHWTCVHSSAGGSATEQSPLSPLQHRQTPAGNGVTASRSDFQSIVMMTT